MKQVIQSHRHLTVEEKEEIEREKDFLNQPHLSQLIKDRVEQSLAQLALMNVENQYPFHVVFLEKTGKERSIAESVNDRITNYIKKLTKSQLIPYLEPTSKWTEELYEEKPLKENRPKLVEVPLEVGPTSKVLEITGLISEGTAQGTVYKIEEYPHPALLEVSLFDETFGARQNIPAVMKKSPIYHPILWIRYHILKLIEQMMQNEQPIDMKIIKKINPPLYNYIYSKLTETQREYILKKIKTSKSDLRETISEIEKRFIEEYNDINNDAYVDAIGYFMGSELVSSTTSPFYPLLYDTFRVYDSAFFPENETISISPHINKDFPVEVIIMQPLNGDLRDLIESEWFSDEEGDLLVDKTMAIFAQIVFGLAIGQETFDLVHNDFHIRNLMYEDVSQNFNLYYRQGDIFYRIPTYGKIMKQIDFGRSTFRLGEERMGSTTNKNIYEDWNLSGKNNDLLRIVSMFVFFDGIEEELKGPSNQFYKFYKFANSVLNCNGKTMFDRWNECLKKNLDAKKGKKYNEKIEERCEETEIDLFPYIEDSTCKNAVPKNNIKFFKDYIVSKEEIPSNAIVYMLPI